MVGGIAAHHFVEHILLNQRRRNCVLRIYLKTCFGWKLSPCRRACISGFEVEFGLQGASLQEVWVFGAYCIEKLDLVDVCFPFYFS